MIRFAKSQSAAPTFQLGAFIDRRNNHVWKTEIPGLCVTA